MNASDATTISTRARHAPHLAGSLHRHGIGARGYGATAMHEWRQVLAAPAFRRFWLALLANNLGNWCVIAALPILVASRFGAGEELVLSLGLRVLPKILLAPVAGDLLRRMGSTRVASRSLIAMAGLTALLPWCEDFVALQAVIALIGVLDVFVMPALLSLRVPVTPPGREMAGNTLCSVADRSAKIAGPILAGAVLFAGFVPGFLLFAIGNLGAALTVARLPDVPRDPTTQGERWRLLTMPAEFVRILASDSRLLGLLIAAVTYMVMLGGLRPFLFWANRDWFGATDTAWTGLLAAQGVGALIGAALAAMFSQALLARLGAYPLTLLSGIVEGLLLLCLIVVETPVQAMIVLALASMPEIISTASWFTAFQQRLAVQRQGVFLAFSAPLWDIAYMGGVAAGGFYTVGVMPLSAYWALVTLSATIPLVPLLLLSAARAEPGRVGRDQAER